ncbi:MAG TPA: hypothetical protein VGI44_02460, partial [Acidimicrobiales bacterium]
MPRDGRTSESQARAIGLGAALWQAGSVTSVGWTSRWPRQGFEDRGFPDGRVLRICSRIPEATISQIGRELGITRQGAGKVVAARGIERQLPEEVGERAFDGLSLLLAMT